MKHQIPLVALLLGMLNVPAAVEAAVGSQAVVAFITTAEGPHLNEYLVALSEVPEVGAVLLCDPTGAVEPLARRSLGAKLQATYATVEELLSKHRPQLVLISLEPRLASPAVAKALDAGCHVLAEKPAFLEAGELAVMKRKADEKGLFLMLALANRLNPETKLARDLIERNTIGRVYGVELHLIADQTRLRDLAYQKSWFAHKTRAGGGHLIWLGLHWIDLAMYLTGADVTQVCGFTANVGGQPLDIEDSATITMKFDQGFLGTMTSGYYLDEGYHSHLKIWGSTGWLEINLFGGETPMRYYSSADQKPEIKTYSRPVGVTVGYTPFVAACVRAALGNGTPPVSNRDSLRIIETVYTAYRASEVGYSAEVTIQRD